MYKLKFTLMTLAVVMSTILWGMGQGQAAPTLNPNVDLSKPNYAYSPPLRKFVDSLPGLGSGTRTVDTALGSSTLGQYIPIASPTTPPAGVPTDGDYYEIALVEYHEQLHRDLPPVTGTWPNQSGGTKLRGYVQENNGVMIGTPHYLGPMILATKGRPVRIKFTNRLPLTAAGGDLFIPVDVTLMGAGKGPKFANGADCDPATQNCASYTQNRSVIHLHGGLPPWISDGTAHQWITPAGESTPYLKGASMNNVPDMPVPPQGSVTMYWSNQQSGRLMFYHDHAVGITRLNVYAGEAAGYLVVDPTEETSLAAAGVPGTTADLAHLIPLVIQDKTFVYDNSITTSPAGLKDPTRFTAVTDPLWASSALTWGGATPPAGGNLWFPHVYEPNQDPTSLTGANPLGRWDYGPWFWPVFPATTPYPPTVSTTPEAFMDTPIVNGAAYPYLDVAAAPYRLRILNACNDRMLNLQFYQADSGYTTAATATATINPATGVVTGITLNNGGTGYAPNSTPMVHIVGGGGFGAWATATVNASGVVTTVTLTNGGALYTAAPTVTIGGSTEVRMIPAVPNAAIPFPPLWLSQTPGMTPDILDSRLPGVPDPTLRGPAMIQIGTEGGLLPAPVVLPNTPVGFEQNKRNIVVLNVLEKTLFIGPAERADVIVDFSQYAGKTVILYNDSPTPVPAGDPRYDFYTGNPDYSATGGANYQGGAPSTMPGYGPNTRTIMQFRVAGTDPNPGVPGPTDAVPGTLLTSLNINLPLAFAATQDKPVVPQPDFPAASGGNAAATTYARISDTSLTFTPLGSSTAMTMPLQPKTIQELFDPEGRMNATLGVELPFTNAGIQTTVPLGFTDPPTDILKPGETQFWKITHNGVDTHAIHFHLVNVQVINRVGWDGAIRPPDQNELAWKETVRMNPLEDIVVAMRAKVPTYPFAVPDSVRPHNPALPIGATFSSFDPLTGAPTTVTNVNYNFGHEYVWHCHILGHEENDMMRPLVLNENSLLYAVNAGNGLWQWDSGVWTQINTAVPTSIVGSGSLLYAALTGAGGLWQWNGNAWSQINNGVPASMIASGTMLYATFTGAGLWQWDGSAWSQINNGVPASMVASGETLYAAFTGFGLWQWNGKTWSQINSAAPVSMAASGTLLYANFAGAGLWKWNGSAWSQVNPAVPASMLASGTNLYAVFGTSLYQWNGTAWSQINSSAPTSMLASGTNLYAVFGTSLYQWNGSAWSQINNTVPARMVATGTALYADFTGTGIWKWDGTAWTQLTVTDPTLMLAGF